MAEKEYIEREALIADCERAIKSANEYRMAIVDREFIDIVEAQEVTDVMEVVHGKWDYDGIALVCNKCSCSIVVEQGTADMNYCPNCGAKMDGDENG